MGLFATRIAQERFATRRQRRARLAAAVFAGSALLATSAGPASAESGPLATDQAGVERCPIPGFPGANRPDADVFLVIMLQHHFRHSEVVPEPIRRALARTDLLGELFPRNFVITDPSDPSDPGLELIDGRVGDLGKFTNPIVWEPLEPFTPCHFMALLKQDSEDPPQIRIFIR